MKELMHEINKIYHLKKDFHENLNSNIVESTTQENISPEPTNSEEPQIAQNSMDEKWISSNNDAINQNTTGISNNQTDPLAAKREKLAQLIKAEWDKWKK